MSATNHAAAKVAALSLDAATAFGTGPATGNVREMPSAGGMTRTTKPQNTVDAGIVVHRPGAAAPAMSPDMVKAVMESLDPALRVELALRLLGGQAAPATAKGKAQAPATGRRPPKTQCPISWEVFQGLAPDEVPLAGMVAMPTDKGWRLNDRTTVTVDDVEVPVMVTGMVTLPKNARGGTRGSITLPEGWAAHKKATRSPEREDGGGNTFGWGLSAEVMVGSVKCSAQVHVTCIGSGYAE